MTTQKSLFDQLRDKDYASKDKCFLFYDWFCSSSSLERRAKPLTKMCQDILLSSLFDARTSYVFFKNNCPLEGPTYDSLSICDCVSGDVQFHIRKREGLWEVFCVVHDFKDPVFSARKAKDVVDWFLRV